jgi:N-hydroxyarylamine O-acetyltransferase
MNIDQYLKKLNIEKKAPTLDYLNEIIASHQKTISFNNLAVFFRPGQILNLELGPLFDKVIVRGNGGYCFENNKVFYYLLKDLGFEVEAKAARVLYNNPGDVPRTHRTTIVRIGDGRYLADVGFGRDVPTSAIKIGTSE